MCTEVEKSLYLLNSVVPRNRQCERMDKLVKDFHMQERLAARSLLESLLLKEKQTIRLPKEKEKEKEDFLWEKMSMKN